MGFQIVPNENFHLIFGQLLDLGQKVLQRKSASPILTNKMTKVATLLLIF
jgi:hypothetical protein